MSVAVADQHYVVEVRRDRRAKFLTLRTDPSGDRLLATLPPGVGELELARFVRSKAAWIEDRFAKAGPLVALIDGSRVDFRGRPRVIRWEAGTPRQIRLRDDCIALGGPQAAIPRRVYAWLRHEALDLIEKDTDYYRLRAGLDGVAVRLSNARRRWGSCSSKTGIRVNWRLIMAPDTVRRAVVAHEVAHLLHMHHGPAFYACLDGLFEGDRGFADRWLDANGPRLYRVMVPRRD